MSTPDHFPSPSKKTRTTREIIDGMPTPANNADTFALFAALELEAMENGKSTPKESAELLREVFHPEQD
jgi:hypothetical protein